MIMNVIHPLHVLVVISLLCMKPSSFESKSLSNYSMTMKCIEKEKKALLVLKYGVFGAHRHDRLHSWKKDEENCCKWEGVGCDSHTGHVTRLHLSSLIAASYVNTTSVSISRSLLDLPYLNYLDLSNNFLGRTTIPESIGSLTKLVHLDLSVSHIWGSISDQIGNLSNLQYLNLSFNHVDGPIPKFIGSLNNLRYLDLSQSYFSGVIPHELGNLTKLQHLAIGNSDLTGGKNFKWLYNLSSLTHLDLSGISFATCSSIWVSFIQRIPSISVMHLNYCNLLAPSSTFSNFSSSISTLHLRGNHIHSSIFNQISHLNGSLVELDLSDNMLQGRISESLSHMTALTYLDLSENKLDGMLPKSIYNCSNLKVIDFSFNNFSGNLEDILSGPFPFLQELLISANQLTGSLPDITKLSSLMHLKVDFNQLSGCLPTVFEHHSTVKILNLSNNHLRGSLPDFTGFQSLESLYLDGNEFSGSVPDFTGCSSLRILRLGRNHLTEWASRSTGLLSSLEELDLSVNSISSKISEAHLFNLSKLKYMRTSSNFLTFEFSSEWLPPFQLRELSLASCKLGPKFPIWIRNQQHIDHIDISNSQISDTIPIWFLNLSNIIHLNLSSNKIRGGISAKLYSQEIDLSSNVLDGPLPPIYEKCLKLNLSHNKFSGTLLSLSVVEDLSLRFLDISNNHLFGALPDNWMYFQGLVFLNLGYNNFSGRIPTSIGSLESLEALILRNNKLYGELPASLRECRSLGFADFGLNKLSGTIYPWAGEDLNQLYALILKSNRFNGSIPYEMCHLSNLHFLDISINKISGSIPPCFDNLTAMMQKGTAKAEHAYSSTNSFTERLVAFASAPVYLASVPSEFSSAPSEPASAPSEYSEYIDVDSSSYTDHVLARWKGQEFEYGRNFAYLKMIDLSTNEMTGEIPLGITNLLELKGLNLSGNGFYGKVPTEIGQLKALECLDLSKNNFTGEIPVSMSGLNFLAYLDLSDNNFSGRIPSGTQLQGFNISTYEGNTRLCGKPLTNFCPGNEPDEHMRPSSDEHEVEGDNSDEYERSLYISAALGFSTSFWGIIGSLVLNIRWRRAYFFFLYNLKERFYVAMAVRIARFQRTV